MSRADQSNPGDIYCDFTLGHPAYFDLYKCTTQPSSISSCASQTGVAAAAGEVAKDDHCLDTF